MLLFLSSSKWPERERERGEMRDSIFKLISICYHNNIQKKSYYYYYYRIVIRLREKINFFKKLIKNITL